MNYKTILTTASALGLALVFASPANSASMGNFLRKGKDTIHVSTKGGKLYCKRKSDGFELCHGMEKKGNAWKGKKMKHPDMPGFMTFNGTVTFSSKGSEHQRLRRGQLHV